MVLSWLYFGGLKYFYFKEILNNKNTMQVFEYVTKENIFEIYSTILTASSVQNRSQQLSPK
jgi:hypothetical protein